MEDLQSRRIELFVALAIVANLVIVVPAGHGLACLGLIEVFWFPIFNHEGFTLLPTSFDESIGAAAVFSFVGQVGLLLMLITRKFDYIKWGLMFTYIGYGYLVHSLFYGERIAIVSFLTGLPFVSVSFYIHAVLRSGHDHD